MPKSNVAFLGLGLIAAFWLVRDHFPVEWGGQIGLAALLVVVGLPLTWAATRVQSANLP